MRGQGGEGARGRDPDSHLKLLSLEGTIGSVENGWYETAGWNGSAEVGMTGDSHFRQLG